MKGNAVWNTLANLLLVGGFTVGMMGIASGSLNAQAGGFLIPDIYPSDQESSINALVRIDISKDKIRLPQGIEIAGMSPDEWVDVIIPRWQISEIALAGADYEVIHWDVGAHQREMAGSYHTLAQIESMLQDIADNYPGITSLYSIGTTHQDRQVYCLEITDNPGVDEGEPGVLFMGLHHAREWPTVEICLNIADQLTSLYGSDPDVTDVVNNRRLWLVTVVNPDGYYYCHDQGHDWRKNRHYFSEFGTWGVDLNRNYGGSSNGDIWGAWGSIGEGSVTHNPDYSTYCGPMANSEKELQNVQDLFLENDICAVISWHTSGELILWPWGYSANEQTPDNTYLSWVGQQVASRIGRQGSGTYTPQQSSGLYPTTGDATDWFYGYSHYEVGKTAFPYTIEACNEFQPPQSALDQIVAENFDGALFFLQEADNIDAIDQRVIPPVIDNMGIDQDGNYRVSWDVLNPDSDPDVFRLNELTGLSTHTDDSEGGTGFWDMDGFTQTTSRYHSSNHSFKSHTSDYTISGMTSLQPLPVTAGMKLSFWTWYNIEEDWDFGFVEVSRDGRSYDVLDTFTGSSGGWDYLEYGLGVYSGESVFIRFRYSTDANTSYDGFFVDDIYPLADFATETTLSSSITNTYYDVTGNSPGTYYYRVMGHNSTHGWGDFSTLESIRVSEFNVKPPQHDDKMYHIGLN
jgi:hypothetical protein